MVERAACAGPPSVTRLGTKMDRVARGSRLVVAVLCVAGALLSGTARAEDDEELIRQGIEQRRIGQDLRALDLFRRAVALKKTPRGMGQMALAEQALGLWVKAEQDMKAALAQPNDAWIRSHRKTLDSALAVIEDHLGTLELWGEPAAAEVRAGGRRAGDHPHPPRAAGAGRSAAGGAADRSHRRPGDARGGGRRQAAVHEVVVLAGGRRRGRGRRGHRLRADAKERDQLRSPELLAMSTPPPTQTK